MPNASITTSTSYILRTYLKEVKSTPSEIGKRERFGALLGTLFPNAREVGIYTQGGEKALKIQLVDRQKTGRVDTFYGSAVVEFEKSLRQTLSEAERQLREYVAGVWQKDEMSRRGLDAVATDGIRWRIYRPVLPEGAKLVPENIELELRREIELKDETQSDFTAGSTTSYSDSSISIQQQRPFKKTLDRQAISFSTALQRYGELGH